MNLILLYLTAPPVRLPSTPLAFAFDFIFLFISLLNRLTCFPLLAVVRRLLLLTLFFFNCSLPKTFYIRTNTFRIECGITVETACDVILYFKIEIVNQLSFNEIKTFLIYKRNIVKRTNKIRVDPVFSVCDLCVWNFRLKKII